MNTVLINPLFIFSNVVYIKPERKYILIRRETWNTVVRLVFKRNKPSVVDLRKLKECFYRGYKKWSDNNGKSVDFKSWNREISDLQNKVTDRKVPDQVLNYVDFKDQPTIKFEDESFFDDEFLDPDCTRNKLDVDDKQVQLFKSYSDKVETSKQQILDILNFNVSISPVHKGLIDFLGFGRLVSLSSQIRSDVVVKNLSDLVVVFLKANPQFLYSCLSFRNISIYFLCQRCGVLNGHSKKYGEKMSTMIENHGRSSLLYYYKDLPLTEANVNFNDFNQDVSYPLVSVLDCNEFMSYSYKDICRGYSGQFLNYCDGRELIDIIKLVHLVYTYKEFMNKLEMEINLIYEPHFKEKHFLNTIRFYLDILETDCYRKFFNFHICNVDCNVNNCSFLCNYVFQPDSFTVTLDNVSYFKLYGSDIQKEQATKLSDNLTNNFGAFLNFS